MTKASKHMDTARHCLNCGALLHDRYCPHCGQPSDTGRLSFSDLRHEVVHFFSHMEHGFLFTSLNMLLRPARVVTEYVSGKRKPYQPPISYFLIWVTLYVLLLYGVERAFGANRVVDYQQYFGPDITTRLAISHLGLVLTAVMPFHALYLYLLITTRNYNYYESLVAVIYSLGTVILVQSLFVLVAVLVHMAGVGPLGLNHSDPLKVLYISFFAVNMAQHFNPRYKWWRVLAFVVLAFGTFTVWRILGVRHLAHFIH